MDITIKFKDDLRDRFVALLDSKRGIQTTFANVIGKNASYFSEIKRGNPVNALHLKAVGIVFGPDKVSELLGITSNSKVDVDTIHKNIVSLFKQKELALELNRELLKLERINPAILVEILQFIKFRRQQESVVAGESEAVGSGTAKDRNNSVK